MLTSKRSFLIVITIFLWLIVGYQIASASGSGFLIDWWTVDAGGGQLSGGNFTVNGTVGQAETATLSGGAYALEGGFWHNNSATPTAVDALTGTTSPTLPFYLLLLCAVSLTLLTIRNGRLRGRLSEPQRVAL